MKPKKHIKDNTVWLNNFAVENAGHHLGAFELDGIQYGERVIFETNHIKEWFLWYEDIHIRGGLFKEKELMEMIHSTMDIILNHPEKAIAVNKGCYWWNDEYFRFSKTILDMDLSELNDKELCVVYLYQITLQEKGHMHAITTTWFVDSQGEHLSEHLLNITKKKVEQLNLDLDFAQAFSILTTKPKNSILIDSEIKTLEIAEKISKDKIAKKIFQNLTDSSKLHLGLPKNIKSAILDHYKKWRWMPFTYIGPAYELEHYIQVWSGLIRQKTNIISEIKKLKERPRQVKKERDQIIKILRLNKSEKQLFDIAADIVFLKGYRKEAVFHGSYALSFLLKEIARRIGLSLNQVYLLGFKDVEDFLLKHIRPDIDEINSRTGKTIYHIKGDKLYCYKGKKAEMFFASKNIKEEKIDENTTELKGTTACSGNATGMVRIINTPQDMVKMKEGDIMVSHTTFPSLVPAMKKAAAIISEDGGITCHAAIVSRELKTPCITGIKNATKVLKDGYKIEVLAGKGIVNILAR